MKPGTIFRGKWSGITLAVDALLGAGANGAVYLVATDSGKAAMKVCQTSAQAALEWSVLTAVHQAGATAFPRPIVIDDGPAGAPFFYVMEWIDGESLTQVIERRDWTQVKRAVELILLALADLHHTGHAFCDLKPENILVTKLAGGAIRFVDVGGVTAFGRAVRQFTPQTDRAYYGFGSRKSEVSYDLAALALGILLSWQQVNFSEMSKLSLEERRRWIERALAEFPDGPVSQLFQGALAGGFVDAQSFLAKWKGLADTLATSGRSSERAGRQAKRSSQRMRMPRQQQQRGRDWTEWVMWISIGSAASATVVAWLTFFFVVIACTYRSGI